MKDITALPAITAVTEGLLLLDNGETVLVNPDKFPRLVLVKLKGQSVLAMDWQNQAAPRYRVPTHLCESVSRMFDLVDWY